MADELKSAEVREVVERAVDAVAPMQTFPVSIPLPSGEWFALCHCQTPEAVAEVLRVLLSARAKGPSRVLVEVIYV
jgi:hypothetical protein